MTAATWIESTNVAGIFDPGRILSYDGVHSGIGDWWTLFFPPSYYDAPWVRALCSFGAFCFLWQNLGNGGKW
jgi:hypothetical protein